ncbi:MULTISPECIES: transposase domain-containing protein [unclassified Nostoc]|uniref:transposase domain-containing protein n=1 Tax=unclassified Nostoc TaxID=2593658 RepID=UPI0025E68182|nr:MULTISPECIES: transposase domain-containing protein [unclassified Nostoc]
MQLKEFSLISPVIESGTVRKALETAIPTGAVSQAIADTDSNEERKRALVTHVVICLVIAMSLWSKASMRTNKNVRGGVWILVSQNVFVQY